MSFFILQIRLACELKKPLFLHEREAHAEVVRLLELYRDRGLPHCVIHCFTGNKEQAQKYLSMGCYIGLTGNGGMEAIWIFRHFRHGQDGGVALGCVIPHLEYWG